MVPRRPVGAHEFAPVGAAERLAGHHLVGFGDHVLHGEVGVGEGPAKHGREMLEALAVWRHSWRGAVVDELGGANLVYGVDAALALYLIDEAADQGLVLCRRARDCVGGHPRRSPHPPTTGRAAHRAASRLEAG